MSFSHLLLQNCFLGEDCATGWEPVLRAEDFTGESSLTGLKAPCEGTWGAAESGWQVEAGAVVLQGQNPGAAEAGIWAAALQGASSGEYKPAEVHIIQNATFDVKCYFMYSWFTNICSDKIITHVKHHFVHKSKMWKQTLQQCYISLYLTGLHVCLHVTSVVSVYFQQHFHS